MNNSEKTLLINNLEKPLITESLINKRVRELAYEISEDYESITAIAVLNGALLFAADLLRLLTIPAKIDSISVSSYGMKGTVSNSVNIIGGTKTNIENNHILLIEDIVDTGQTVNVIQKHLQKNNPKSIKLCTLLSKPSRRKFDVNIDYVGFEISDKFVVGYGIDHKENYRFLKYITTLKKI